jgi:HSP20 family protein
VSATTTSAARDRRHSRRQNQEVPKEVVLVVMRFDPFRDFDRLTERLLTTAADLGQSMRAMPLDVYRSGDQYVLHCDLPGVDPGSIDVGVDGRTLTIRAQRSPRADEVEWLTHERPTGAFVRQLSLGAGLDVDHIEASYADGVLTLSIPVAEQAKPRKVEVAHVTGQTSLASGQARPEAVTAG